MSNSKKRHDCIRCKHCRMDKDIRAIYCDAQEIILAPLSNFNLLRYQTCAQFESIYN